MRWLLFCTVERKNWCQTDMMYTPLMPIGCVTPQNWCQTRGCCRNPELNLRCRGMVCNSLVMQTSTRICNVFFAHFCKCLAIANYQALGLTQALTKLLINWIDPKQPSPIFMHKVLPQESSVQRNKHNLHIGVTLDYVKVVLVLLLRGCVTVKKLHQTQRSCAQNIKPPWSLSDSSPAKPSPCLPIPTTAPSLACFLSPYTANELLARHKFLLAKLLVTFFR